MTLDKRIIEKKETLNYRISEMEITLGRDWPDSFALSVRIQTGEGQSLVQGHKIKHG